MPNDHDAGPCTDATETPAADEDSIADDLTTDESSIARDATGIDDEVPVPDPSTETGVPVSHPQALDRYWSVLRERLIGTRAEDVLDALRQLVTNERYVVDQATLAARVGKLIGDPNYDAGNLTAIDALQYLHDAGAISKDDALSPDEQSRVRYLINGDVVKALHDSLSGFPSSLPERATTIARYLGAAHLTERSLDPHEAWLYTTVNEFANLRDPVITIRQIGVPERGEWTEAYPYAKYLLYDAVGGRYVEYATDVVIASASGEFEVTDPDGLVHALREDLMRYHAAALYPRYESFTMAAAKTEFDQAEHTPDPTEPIPSNRVPAFYSRIIHHPYDAAVWLVSLHQIKK